MIELDLRVAEPAWDDAVTKVTEVCETALRAAADQKLQHLSGLRPPVDVVAQMHDPPVLRLDARQISLDPVVYLLQQIKAPMHVANRIDAHSRRSSGIRQRDHRGFRGSEKEKPPRRVLRGRV